MRRWVFPGFTIGMTFQLWDRDLLTGAAGAPTRRRTLLSGSIGAIIIASINNVLSGLSR